MVPGRREMTLRFECAGDEGDGGVWGVTEEYGYLRGYGSDARVGESWDGGMEVGDESCLSECWLGEDDRWISRDG